jgi:hypothetical protein
MLFEKEKLHYLYQLQHVTFEILDRVHIIETLNSSGVEDLDELQESLDSILDESRHTPVDFDGIMKRLFALDEMITPAVQRLPDISEHQYRLRMQHIESELRKHSRC